MSRRLRIMTSCWLAHIDGLLKTPIQESIINIQLPDIPVKIYSKSEDESYCSRLDDWVKRLKIIDTCCLLKTFCNKTCLVFEDGTISLKLSFEDPTTIDELLGFVRRHENLGLVGKQSIVFLSHRMKPLRRRECFGDYAR
ncbi:hypothetical protein QN277_010448 [Acacia crassicarpa]|uniref:Uncharacterized protein n=1 Tax=Acacia crassicarpa TaxID=499986 RepID=A0AAE1M8X8_9FABA|nr:hypothetical protein QN277_010448 [Acacia crassicarpa]